MKNKIFFAPLEGITGSIFRQVFHKYFKGVSEFYTPFITPKEKRGIDKKDILEIQKERNEGVRLIPQILTADAEGFQKAVEKLGEFGYREINLNLGCPSGTVVNKGKGAGALKDPERLDTFLDEIFNFSLKKDFRISIKTRIGYRDASEFSKLLEIYKQYPYEKLIIHPRTGKEFYRGKIHHDVFEETLAVLKDSKEKICFNGDITSLENYQEIQEKYPEVGMFMIGRGFLRNPFLVEEMEGSCPSDSETKKQKLKQFLDELFDTYTEALKSEAIATLKLKEIWSYLSHSFEGSEKGWKELKKTKNAAEYRASVNVIFSNYFLL